MWNGKSIDRAILVIVFSASIVVLGYFVGTQVDYHAGLLTRTMAWLVGILLIVVGFLCQYSDARRTFANRVIAIGMLAYFTFMLATEPLLNAVFGPPFGEYKYEAAWSLYLMPFIVGALVFSVRGRWFEAAGCLAILASGVAIVANNARATLGADGFLERMRW
ncbi:MAG TPA: hypothetical protein VKS79_10930 [Gemmataceae bacterium]|nr:hypothetical protein [Gemmataceae bacterium]